MTAESIYSNGDYLNKNPTLHVEDSVYKMKFIGELLGNVKWPIDRPIEILDIGGGGGYLGRLVCDWFHSNGYIATMSALDVSNDMVNAQMACNPNILKSYIGGLDELGHDVYFDLILMIDVIEHIQENSSYSVKLNSYGKYIIYNIPIEFNYIDRVRNFLMKGRYYTLQKESLGHLHFFSTKTAINFIKNHHAVHKMIFACYAQYFLKSEYETYVLQRGYFKRRLELVLSAIVDKVFPNLSKRINQGSLFCLVESVLLDRY